MIAIVHSIYSQSLHEPTLDAGLMDNDAERYFMRDDDVLNIQWAQKKSWHF